LVVVVGMEIAVEDVILVVGDNDGDWVWLGERDGILLGAMDGTRQIVQIFWIYTDLLLAAYLLQLANYIYS
jgi:hypothetical protein